tara:strand:- start:443 stop:1987 length:1545 start_codon:yes stop_codon:yes gene_type:complete
VKFIKNNLPYHFLAILISLSSFFLSIWNYQYIYDFEHAGILFNNSLLFLEGNLPYKDIYILQGFTTLLINFIALLIFGEFLYLIYIISATVYAATFLFLYNIITKFSDVKISICLVTVIFLIHPNIYLPWGNYNLFFFLVLSLFFFLNNSKFFIILSGAFLALATLSKESFLPFYFLLILFLLIFWIFSNEKKDKKKILYFLIGNSLTVTSFILYLIGNNILLDFIEYYQSRSTLFGSIFNYNNYFKDFVLNFFNLTNFFFEPVYIIFFFIFLFCTFFIFRDFSLKEKIKFEIIFIFILSGLTLSQVVIFKDDIFRYICGPSLILICFSHYIYKLKNLRYYITILLMLYAFSGMSILDHDHYDKKPKIITKNFTQNNINYFKNFIWETHRNNDLELVDEYFNKINSNCDISFIFHLGKDHFYSILSKKYFKNVSFFPSYFSKENSYYKISNLQSDLFTKIRTLSIRKDILFLITDKREKSFVDKLILNNYYELNIIGKYKNENIKFFLPTTCVL